MVHIEKIMSYYTLRDWATAILAVAGLILALSVAYASCCLGQDEWGPMTLYDDSNKQSVHGLNEVWQNDSGPSWMAMTYDHTNRYLPSVYWKADATRHDTVGFYLGTPDTVVVAIGHLAGDGEFWVDTNVRGPLAWMEYIFPMYGSAKTATVYFIG